MVRHAVDESAWLIETSIRNTPCWLSSNPCRLFSTAYEAIRFRSKQDAEAVIRLIELWRPAPQEQKLVATSHSFYTEAYNA